MPPALELVTLDPNDTLLFRKTPNTQSPARTLKITNAVNAHVAFKVKTTAPKSYLVRPSSGTLGPRGETEVQIIVQPQIGDEKEASAHRFLVQATEVPGPGTFDKELWQSRPKDQIQEHRLNVVLEESREDQPSGKLTNEQPAYAGTNNLTTGAGETPPADLKVKYDELVQYTLVLEKEKKKLEVDLASLTGNKGGSNVVEGYGKLQLLLVALLAFCLSYAAKFFV